MNILLAASEIVPYAKTGGLADVAGALPKALARLGHKVRVVMPRYNLERINQNSSPLAGDLVVPFNFGERKTEVFIDRSGPVPVYFIDAPEYFSRTKLYGEADDAERFAFFSRAIIELAKALGEHIDVIHLNDWMTGLVSAYLKTVYSGDSQLEGTRTLFTIHNMAFHGLFAPDQITRFGLPEWIYRTEGGLEFYGLASSLKAGLVFADAISTVSPRYSREIQTADFGERFDGLLQSRHEDLFGILNGVDYDEWDPISDKYIASHYSIDDIAGKRECKRELLKTFELPEDLDRPLIGCISRLSDQKGFDLILQIAEPMLDLGVSFVLLGSGTEAYERAFQNLREKRPSQVAVYLGFSNELAHKIEAGSDMFLMPSKFEPCGLNQMYSLRYGTVPIVRAAGGLDDSIENFDRVTMRGNGLKFEEYRADRLLEKIREAVELYSDQSLWQTLMRNGMEADFSWDSSAKQYIELYQRLVGVGASATV